MYKFKCEECGEYMVEGELKPRAWVQRMHKTFYSPDGIIGIVCPNKECDDDIVTPQARVKINKIVDKQVVAFYVQKRRNDKRTATEMAKQYGFAKLPHDVAQRNIDNESNFVSFFMEEE